MNNKAHALKSRIPTVGSIYRYVKRSVIQLRNERSTTKLMVVTLSAVIIFNSIASFISFRIDFSPGHAYTLTKSTKKIVKSLDDTATIKVFISSNLPVALTPLKTDVLDLIGEFKKAGKRKIVVQIVDPKTNVAAQQEARSLGLPQLQFSQIEKNDYAVSASYFGIVLSYQKKQELIPQATSVESLEYDIASALNKMSAKAESKVGLIGTDQTSALSDDQFYSLKTILGKQYVLENISLASESGSIIDPSFQAVIVADPENTAFDQYSINQFRHYLDQNGQLIFMVDGVYVSDQLQPSEANNNLFSFFKDYGITMHRNFVLSNQSEIANFTTTSGGFFASYPYWIKTNNISHDSPQFANSTLLTFPWAAKLETKDTTLATAIPVVLSTKDSWLATDSTQLLPNKAPLPDRKTMGEHAIVAEATTKKGGHLMVISSSRFIKEQFLAAGRDNMNFLLNVVNNYASKGVLSGIRARFVKVDVIREIPDGMKDPIKYMAIFLLPTLVGLYGIKRLKNRS